MPGKYWAFICSSCILAAFCGSLAYSITGMPFEATATPSEVPYEPAPITVNDCFSFIVKVHQASACGLCSEIG